MNSDTGQMAVSVDNPSLSINAFDKHDDAIRAGVARLSSLLGPLSNTSVYKALKSKLAIETQSITSVKILRIIKNGIAYDVYITFTIGDEEYWGVIENILDTNSELSSEAFRDMDLILTKEWVIKTKGLIIRVIKQWLNPENGSYELINDYILCYSTDTGKSLQLNKGCLVDVIRSYDNKIVILYKNSYFELHGDNYMYFNYWFIKK